MVNTSRLDSLFGALADPTRRRMIERLAHGPLSIGVMSAGLDISQPGISRHVRVLEDAGLLRREIVGRTHRCRLEPKAIEAASAWIDAQRQFWNDTLDRLDALLAQTAKPKTKKGR